PPAPDEIMCRQAKGSGSGRPARMDIWTAERPVTTGERTKRAPEKEKATRDLREESFFVDRRCLSWIFESETVIGTKTVTDQNLSPETLWMLCWRRRYHRATMEQAN
ncbi:MAG: hypothetical protein ABSG31_17035, partial [Tepidisphaeraceae bacterium]